MPQGRGPTRPLREGARVRPASPFARFAQAAAVATGKPWAFGAAFGLIVAWALSGPLFRFSDTWQLVINTGTTIITFLMVFLIQHQQNRDSEAMQIKLDEIIRATHGAHVALLDLEELSDKDIRKIRSEYEQLAADARRDLRGGTPDTGTPEPRPHRPS